MINVRRKLLVTGILVVLAIFVRTIRLASFVVSTVDKIQPVPWLDQGKQITVAQMATEENELELLRDVRYHDLDPFKIPPGTPATATTAYTKAETVTRARWFEPRKICKQSCCAQTVAISLDQDDNNIINSLDGPDLADVVIWHNSEQKPEVFASSLSDEILPCLQPGTIIHADNHAHIYEEFFDHYLKNITVPYLFMTTESDADSPISFLPEYRYQLDDKRLISWYGTNPKLETTDKPERRAKFTAMPLGLSKHHPQTPYLEHYLRVRNYTNPFSGDLKRRWTESKDLVYTNNTSPVLFVKFNVHEHALDRRSIFDALCKGKKPHDSVSCSLNVTSPHEIYKVASKYLFGLSPPGAGYDCYRTYELLLLGVIPIVQKRDDKDLFQDLPVIRVDNLNKTQGEYLQIMRDYVASDEFQRNDFAGWERLFLRYWRRKLLKDTGRDKEIISDERGRQYYQAWKYTALQGHENQSRKEQLMQKK